MARRWLGDHSANQEAPEVSLRGSWMLCTPSLCGVRLGYDNFWAEHWGYFKLYITQQENLLRFPLLLLKRRTPFIHRKWRILLISSSCIVNQKRNSGGIPFEESSAVTPQVEYSFLPPKTDGSPHFLLLWRFLLVPSV